MKNKQVKIVNTSYTWGSTMQREFQVRVLKPFEGWTTRGVFFNQADARLFAKALKG